MKKTLLIIGMCIVLLLGVGASYKLSLSLILNEYEEECYRYKIHYWNETYCKSTMSGTEFKNTNEEHPCCDDETFNVTWGHNGTIAEQRWCLAYPFDKSFWEFTDECAEYHLVRKVGGYI